MPNTHNTLTALFTDIANAIREKDGTSTQKVADAFPAAIRAIPSAEDEIIAGDISGEYVNPRVSEIKQYAFYICNALTSVRFPECRDMGNNAFANCSKLTTAIFPKLLIIPPYAFRDCSKLTTISAPLTSSLGVSAFYSCVSLVSAAFPEATNVAQSVFQNCTALTTIHLPNIHNVGNGLFSNCKALVSLYLTTSFIPSLTTLNAFTGTPISNSTYLGYFGSIIVRSSLLSAFQTAANWSRFSSRFSAWNEVD